MGLGDEFIPAGFISNKDPEDHELEINSLRSLVYVGMTRAKETVTLVGHHPFSRLFDVIDHNLLDQLN